MFADRASVQSPVTPFDLPFDCLLTINKEKTFKYNKLTTLPAVYKKINEFINARSSSGKVMFRTYNHPFRGFNVCEDDYSEFVELMARYSLLDDESKKYGLCVGRKLEDKHVLMLDLDVKTVDKHVYTEYLSLFYNLADAIAEFLGSKKFSVFSRKEYLCKEKTLWKNGAHVLYRDIVISPDVSPDFSSSKEINECLDKIYNIDTSVNRNDIIDKVAFGNGLIGLIGSRKPESSQYWPVVKDNTGIHLQEKRTSWNDDDLLKRMDDIRASLLIPTNSMTGTSDCALPYSNGKNKKERVLSIKKEMTANEKIHSDSCSNDFIASLVDLIGTEYLSNYDSWLRIGMAIKQTGGSIELFDKISQKAKNYKDFDEIETKWNSFRDYYEGNKVTIGTLKYYARLSNPAGYESLCERNKTLEHVVNNYTDRLMVEYLCNNSNSTESFIKDLICRCSKETNRISLCVEKWYRFNGVYYKEIDEGIIKKTLFDPLYNSINEIYADYKAVVDVLTSYEECETKNDFKKLKASKSLYNIKDFVESFDGANKKKVANLKKKYSSLAKKAQFVRDKIKDNCEENRLLTCLQDYTILKNADYISEYNNKTGTVVFENCVYDAHTKERIDFDKNHLSYKKNTFSCKRNFTGVVSQETIDLFEKYMSSLFPDIRIRELMYELLAKMLTPDPIQYILFFTGVGSNGKSCFISFLEKLLGDYFKAATGGFFSGEVKKGTCDPELVDTIHRRCISVNEPSKGIKLAGSFIKSLTGDDYITARPLYKDPLTWKPTAKHIITCNDIPSTDDLSEGFKRRLIIIPFTTRFLGEEAYKKAIEEDEPDVAIHDDELIKKIMSSQVLDEIATLLITKYYNIRTVYDLPDPCKKFKEEYIRSNDPIDSWIEECIETVSEEDTNEIELQVVYNNYREYIKKNYEYEKVLSKRSFTDKLRYKTKCKISHIGKYPVRGIKVLL